MLNKTKGNMYPWCDFTWNPIKGLCPHDCSYCYMKKYPQSALHLDEKELRTNLGSGNTIFVGSSCDMFAEDVPDEWIIKVLAYCGQFDNRYLFQSKNPERFLQPEYLGAFPNKTILGTTIETNRTYAEFMGKAPAPFQRYYSMTRIHLPKMVSIEPIMDFDLPILVRWMEQIFPQFVSIGADSKGHHLPEPSPEKIKTLIEALRGFTEVKVKSNLKRLEG